MKEAIPRSEYPWWVKMSMWGMPLRAALWKFVLLSIVAAVACIAFTGFVPDGITARQILVGGLCLCSVLFLFSALMYWLTIRWVDRHGEWELEVESDTIAHSTKGGMEKITSTGFEKRPLSNSQQLGRWLMIACTVCWGLNAIASVVLKVQKGTFTFDTVMNLGMILVLLLSLWVGSKFTRWAVVGLSVAGLALGISGNVAPVPLWKEWIDILSVVTGLSLAAPWVGKYLAARPGGSADKKP